MDYPQNKSEEEELPWWEQPPDPEASKEKLLKQIEAIQTYHREIPRALFYKQAAALIYICINIWFMYANLTNSHVGYIGAYMIPQLIIFMDYFLVIKKLKESYKPEDKKQ